MKKVILRDVLTEGENCFSVFHCSCLGYPAHGAPRHQRLQMVRPRDRLLSDLKHLEAGPAAEPSLQPLRVQGATFHF